MPRREGRFDGVEKFLIPNQRAGPAASSPRRRCLGSAAESGLACSRGVEPAARRDGEGVLGGRAVEVGLLIFSRSDGEAEGRGDCG